MFSKFIILTAFAASQLSSLTFASPFPIEARAGSGCSSGLIGDLAALLSAYAPAQSYCTANYALKPTACNAKVKRASATTTTTTKTTSVTTTTTTKPSSATTTTTTKSSSTASKTTTTADAVASAWSVLQQQVKTIVASVCTCIEASPVS